jgi:hypothetical protein
MTRRVARTHSGILLGGSKWDFAALALALALPPRTCPGYE